jgi:hypothetical protein
MRTLRSLAVALGLALAVSPALVACASTETQESSDDVGDGSEAISATSAEVTAAQATQLDPSLHFDLLTPLGTKMMKASYYWMGVQANYPTYPKARMCASNVSKIMFLSGVDAYNQEGVRNLMDDVKAKGAEMHKMPTKNAQFAAMLNTIHGGHLPAGTFVAGESLTSSNPGDQHVGIVGHTDADGVVWLYNNNWYRPENEGGKRMPFMVSDSNLKKGFPRQWMGIPWLKITRDASGKVTDVQDMIPAIDDMNPFNGEYQTTLAIPREILAELPAQ